MKELKFVLFLILFASMAGCVASTTDGESQEAGADESGEAAQEPEEIVVDIQNLSEDARLYTIEGEMAGPDGETRRYTRKEIEYEREGQTVKGTFYDGMVPGLEWIKQNTPENSTFLLWWDYGKTLEGYTGRNSIIIAQSMAILKTVSKYAAMSDEEMEKAKCECEPDERVKDVALALVAEDPKETADIMKEYGADYLLVRDENKNNLWAIASASEKSGEDYVENGELKDMAFNTTVFRTLNAEDLEGFEMVYSDESVVVYWLKD